jgi:hypothetical protein
MLSPCKAWYPMHIIMKLYSHYLKQILHPVYTPLSLVIIAIILLALPSLDQFISIGRQFGVFDGRLYISVYKLLAFNISVMDTITLIFFIIFVISMSINIHSFIYYLKIYRKRVHASGTILSFSGVILGLIGVGCLSCGVLLLSPLITILGLSATLWITQYTFVVYLISIIMVTISSVLLLKRIHAPSICIPPDMVQSSHE